MRSKLETMKRFARMLRDFRAPWLNWFRAEGPLSSGVVEGFKTNANLQKSLGFSNRLRHGNRFLSCFWRST